MSTIPTDKPEAPRLVDALRKSEEQYRFLAETIPVQIWTATPDGRLDFVSQQTATRLGRTREALLAEGWQNVVHPDDLPGAVERWLHSLRTGETYEVEFRLQVVGEGYAWHLARAVPRHGEDGKIVQWFGTNTDIDVQRRQQAHVRALLSEVAQQNGLLALEAEVGLALAQVPDLDEALRTCTELVVRHLGAAFARIWTVDATGKMLDLRASAGQYTHLDGAHGRVAIGHLKIGLIAAERQPHLTNHVVGDPRVADQAWAIREGMVSFAGYPLVVGDNLVGVVALFARKPLSEAMLTVLGSVANAVAQSIERRRSLIEAAAARDVLRRLVDNLPELAWSARPDGVIDFYNQRWFDYTGASAEEMAGSGWQKMHDPAILPKVLERWAHSIETGQAFEMEYPLRGRDGSFRWFLTRVEPLRDGAGKVVRWFGTNTNIHEQREEARKAKEANLAKDEFLATASHELRTPLNAILGWAQLLRSGKLDGAGYRRGVETIERNAKAQVQLIEDILDGSRIITGKLHLEVRSLDMTALVRAALEAIRPAAEAKQIALSVVVEEDAARISGDPERLQQVVWNLANNAVKFTPRGGRVEVRLERSGTHIQLVVVDSGQGIHPDFLPHVFERFRQADGTTTRRHGGLGLGLALVRHLVEAHGGTVRAESEGEGHGARFIIQLPVQAVYENEGASARPRAARSDGHATTVDSLAGVTVLVVDDEADARDLVATVLRASGAEVTTAANARQALEHLSANAPMVMVSDVGMPEVDGYELLRRVRAGAGTPSFEVPAIALTAYSREQDRRLALEAGFQTHVAKPVEPAELVRVVAGLVGFMGRQSSPGDRGAALGRADTFLKLEKILTSQGILDALRFLNSRTSYRFTAIYRFDGDARRTELLVDSYATRTDLAEGTPLAGTYDGIVAQTGRSFTTDNSLRDERLRSHPARGDVQSYCGVLLRDVNGPPYGTLCHFDLVPCDIPVSELTLMEAAVPLVLRALAAGDT